MNRAVEDFEAIRERMNELFKPILKEERPVERKCELCGCVWEPGHGFADCTGACGSCY